MTIGYVLKMYPRFSETFIVNEILELERQGLDIRIYSLRKPDDGRFHASIARVRAPVVYLPHYVLSEAGPILAAHRTLLRHQPRRYLGALRYALTRGHRYAIHRFLQAGVLAEHLMRYPVSRLHAHFASSAARTAMYGSLLLGVPYSFTAHAKDIYHQDVRVDSLRSKIRAAHFVVTVSEFNRQYLHRLMPPDVGEIRRLYNGIDLTAFSPGPAGEREPDLILAVGRLVEKKGFADLIRACALLAERGVNFRCEIVGKGPLHDALERLIGDLGLRGRVLLVGPKPQEEVVDDYRRAAVFALPCVIGRDGNRDGLPTVLLEAMASGLAVISTDVTGLPEIIDHDVNGLIVRQADPAALADALARLLGEPALRAALGAEARRKVEREFDVRRNAAVLRGWFEEKPVSAQAGHVAAVSQGAVAIQRGAST